MDSEKLFEDIINTTCIQDIPIEYIARVAFVVLSLIQDNKYSYKLGE